MDVQLQIRQNALEAQQYMQDLFDWERRVKEKEKGLSNGKASGNSMPAPRGRAASQVAAAPQSLQQPGLTANTKNNSTAIKSTGKSSSSVQQQQQQQQNGGGSNTAAKHTYASYSKWDKLDVDAMLEEDSDEETNRRSKASKSSNQSTAKAAPNQHPSAPRASSAAAPLQAPGSNAAAKVVPAARQPPSTQIQLPNSSGSEEADSSASSQPHLTPISSTYTPPPGTSSSSNQGAAQAPPPAEPSHPPIRNSEPQTSEAWRTRGNDLFKAGQHAYAKECYSRSIALDPASATAYANRAMAELRLMEWPQAEEDCSHALKLEPNHVKALHRRGTARRRLGNTFGAAQDFEHALRMEPGNASLAKERDAAVDAHLAAAQLQMPSRRTRLAVHAKAPLSSPPQPNQHQQQQQQQQQQPSAAASARTPPASSPPTTNSPAPPTPTAKAAPPKPGLVASAQKLDGTDGPEFPLEAVRRGISNGHKSSPSESSQRVGTSSMRVAPSSAAVTAQPPAAAPPPPAAAQPAAVAAPAAHPAAAAAQPAAAGARAVPSPVPPAEAHAKSGGAAEGEESAESGSQGATVATASAEQQARTNKVAAAAAAAASQLHARTLASVRSAPRTSTEFEAVWRSLKGDQGLQARYLGVIPPESLPNVFKASLTPQLLAGILRSLLGCLSTPHHPTSAVSQQGEAPQNATHLEQAGAGAAVENGGSQAAREGGLRGKVLDAGHVGALLRGLSKVPRLSMAAMCMPTRERAELRGLWEHARQQAEGLGAYNGMGSTGSVDQGPLPETEWEALRAAFKL
ncbi:hypothetical protein DUNSADRAFT_9513 [Dunaliella salina]|uniref:RNA-polymerase II-associated protein 3-like C-terminal domain-containing protein n=1 Tax=Dunaliella salina TaxID=3046 RepID=A0ABQ7GHD5_DUNSA|nr:hypothetical protein DUNSADRAFT_9513 [Dunaliella salina]|eukprot:KAF5833987.1 hypothetical protein DUNSADRAFT_9513 [Dunaliella salina]